MAVVNLRPITRKRITIPIMGNTPMIQHAWSEKSKLMIREKQAGKKTKAREIRDPDAEFKACMHVTEKGDLGIPAMAIKASMIAAAHKDIGIEKTLLRKALFLLCDDKGLILKMDCDEPIMREDMVRIGMGSTDMRYRPEFRNWSTSVTFEYDADLLQDEDIINLINRAGFGVGIGEWRPQKGGEFGRFSVDTSIPYESEELS
jgi:hypothetical protein